MKKKIQTSIGSWRGEFPVVMLCGAWITLGDWRTCDKPEIGRIEIAALGFSPSERRPTCLEVLTRGVVTTLGKYATADERRELLTGERIDYGDH
jgi:hypothetical protein